MTAIHENAKHEIAKFSAFKIDLGNEELNKTSLTIQGSLVEQHITRFNVKKAAIEKACAMLEGDFADMLKHYLIDSRSTVFGFIALEEAIAELTKDSWKALIRDVGIYDVMPDKRRDEWDQQKEWVDFTLDNVKDTLFVLLSEQGKFTAEKVDNCFNSLSKSHVTNTPSGFYKRCIFQVSYCKGVIHDLRYVIAKLTGRNTNDFGYYDTRRLLDRIPRDGQWREIDGGAWKIRRYQVGTAHVSFHEDIAWQLNSILATIHGAAIPESFRRKPVKAKKKAKNIELVQDLIPFEVLRLFSDLKPATERKSNNRYAGYRNIPNTFTLYGVYDVDKHRIQQFNALMTLIGGVKGQISSRWTFDYDPTEVFEHIQLFGKVPNIKSHQFYPTNAFLAAEAAAWCDIGDNDICLEPEAGQGNIAQFLPKDRSTLVEVSELQCEILSAKGFEDVVNEDFLSYAKQTTKRFDSIVQNPPFSEGRAEAHLLAAIGLLKEKGRLVAILPTSAKSYDLPTGYDIEWSTERHNEFSGTSVSVIMLKLTKH